MPQSLSAVYLHLVFSTKDRHPFLCDPIVRAETHSYLGGVSKQLDCPPIIVGGVEEQAGVWTETGSPNASNPQNSFEPTGGLAGNRMSWSRCVRQISWNSSGVLARRMSYSNSPSSPWLM